MSFSFNFKLHWIHQAVISHRVVISPLNSNLQFALPDPNSGIDRFMQPLGSSLRPAYSGSPGAVQAQLLLLFQGVQGL